MSDRFDTDALRQWATFHPYDTEIVISSEDAPTERVSSVTVDRARWEAMVADLHAAADRIDRLEDGLVGIRRYLVFAGEDYYPAGGWLDYVGSFDTEDDARQEAARQESSLLDPWAQVVDTHREDDKAPPVEFNTRGQASSLPFPSTEGLT